VFDSFSSEQDSSSSDASTPNKAVTIPVQRPNPSKNADADKDQVASSSDQTPEDDTDSGEVRIAMPSSRPGRSVKSPPQRDSPPYRGYSTFRSPDSKCPRHRERTRPSGTRFARSGWHLSRRGSRTVSRRYARCVPPRGTLAAFLGIDFARSNFVRWWIGTEFWPAAVGSPRRVA
jgi:hypothetical protein